jgi:4-hydroxybenzoyl-CoA thioesterase
MSEVFTLKRQVEFNHCDPAGIVFYPRYFEMISATTERFFADAVDLSWANALGRGGYGTPLGNIDVRFHAPSHLEDWLTFSLSLKKIGESSARFLIECHCGTKPRFTCNATLVYVNLTSGASTPWPAAARATMLRFIAPSSE